MRSDGSGNRRSGVLLHPTSLPGHSAIGTIGPETTRFLERLRDAGQSVWQVLPLAPTGHGDSPYQSFSAFAGNPLLISPELLVKDGLLGEEDLQEGPAASADRIDFGAVIPASRALLERAWRAFVEGRAAATLASELADFREREAGWLDDFALFTAIHESRNRPWVQWPKGLASREARALRRAREKHSDAVDRAAFGQFLFFRQWDAVRARARELGIEILGDLPLFVAHDSADVWVHRDLFDLDGSGMPRVLAGVPPDDFSDDGQLWGNPLYRWERVQERGFDWWIDRARAALRMFDRVRLDHFRGFSGCWAVPAGSTSAREGEWTPVPGEAFFEALRNALGDLPFIAEDLGEITPEVIELRDACGFPGMRILQFGFDGDPKSNEFAPHNLVRDCVVYTGTHDNETTAGWFLDGCSERDPERAEERRRRVLAITGTDGSEIHWDLVRLAMASVADTAILPVQDLLGLGNEARMNAPGQTSGNWTWRLREDDWTEATTERLAGLTRATGRWPG